MIAPARFIDDVSQRWQRPDINTRLQQITSFMIGITRVNHHCAHHGQTAADCGIPFDHLRRERADCGNERIGTRHRV